MPFPTPQLQRHLQALDAKQPDLARSEQTWDRRAVEVNRFEVAADDFALALIERRMALAGKRVLDISFGAGRYLDAFLRRGAQVAGVEISSGMLTHAGKRLDDAGLPYDPAQLVQSSWEALDLDAHAWVGAFDLVFLYMSPAVSSAAMLDKVLRASRKAVSITLYADRRDSLLTRLQAHFGLESRRLTADNGDDLYHIFNVLYLQGYFPELQFEHRRRTQRHTIDNVFERYFSWLFKGEAATQSRRDELRAVLQEMAEGDGLIIDSEDTVGHFYLDKQLRR